MSVISCHGQLNIEFKRHLLAHEASGELRVTTSVVHSEFRYYLDKITDNPLTVYQDKRTDDTKKKKKFFLSIQMILYLCFCLDRNRS